MGLAGTASAHSGTTHAGTPHWLLLLAFLLGVGVVLGSIALGRRRSVPSRRGFLGMFAGLLIAAASGVGLVEIQVVSNLGP